MRIDSHQHFWYYNSEDYGWMADQHRPIKRNFLPKDLKPLLDQMGFDGCIAVQARQIEEETNFLLGLAQDNAFIKGVVGFVDLRLPDVEERLAKYAKNKLLSGVRHVIHDEPDIDFMNGKEFQRGLDKLTDFGLTYDLLTKPPHLPNSIKLVQKFPDQPFVIDHISKPLIADQVMGSWKEDIQEIARSENVMCKLSGMVTEANWNNWQADDLRPYLDIVFEAFGEDRLMIGSDWPVCLLAGQYLPVMKVVIDYVKQFSEEVQAKILGENCARFYGI